MNYVADQTVANAVTVAVGTGGAVCVFSLADSHVVVDVTGWYSTPPGLIAARFVPVVPARLLDTRTAAKVGAGGTVAVAVARAGRRARHRRQRRHPQRHRHRRPKRPAS